MKRITRRSRLLVAGLVLLGLTLVPILPAAALAPGNTPFQDTWARTDQPVAAGAASRTWMWGPSGFSAPMREEYAESPNHMRDVQYFDKTRMEITNPYGNANSIWYVTNGLLAKELVTGQMQRGDAKFDVLAPAEVNVAGDPDDADGPTYATFNRVLSAPAAQPGATLTNRIDRAGAVTDDLSLAPYGVSAGEFVAETNHNVASVFWTFMNSQATVFENGKYVNAQLFQNPYFATGYPLTEAYWARIKVGGNVTDVLIQVFERRVLTYTPGNDAAWQVEAGNVGQHYYIWRYHTGIPTEPQPIGVVDYLPTGAAPLMQWEYVSGEDPSFTIGNQSPYIMMIQIAGPTNAAYSIPACPTCVVYATPAQFTGCIEDISWQDFTLPPGNYRVQITYIGGTVRPGAGHWTVVPDASYGACWAVVQSMNGSPGARAMPQ